jgi:hypothetical protein
MAPGGYRFARISGVLEAGVFFFRKAAYVVNIHTYCPLYLYTKHRVERLYCTKHTV